MRIARGEASGTAVVTAEMAEAPTVADRCRALIAMLRIDAAEPDDDDPVSMQ